MNKHIKSKSFKGIQVGDPLIDSTLYEEFLYNKTGHQFDFDDHANSLRQS